MSGHGTFLESEKILERKYREDSRGKRSNGMSLLYIVYTRCISKCGYIHLTRLWNFERWKFDFMQNLSQIVVSENSYRKVVSDFPLEFLSENFRNIMSIYITSFEPLPFLMC